MLTVVNGPKATGCPQLLCSFGNYVSVCIIDGFRPQSDNRHFADFAPLETVYLRDEAKRQQGRGLEGLGLAQRRLGTRKWVLHGTNWIQIGINLGPTWVQLEPAWSQLGSMLGPTRLKYVILHQS